MMTFSLLRPALAIGVALTLAACGGGSDKATYPIKVEVYGLQYEGLVLSANVAGISDLPVKPASPYVANTAVSTAFPQQIEYGVVYDVMPKGATDADYAAQNYHTGAQPKHQSCAAGAQGFPRTNTAGLLATIDVVVTCSINSYSIAGKITGLTGTGLVLINGSAGGAVNAVPVLDATTNLPTDIAFGYPSLNPVLYGTTYGVTILTQPTGQTCTVSGGGNGKGAGTMDDAAEANGGVGDILVTCKSNS